MKAGVVLAGLAALATAALVAACGDEEILLARLPAAKEGGVPIEPRRCVDVTDCTGDAYCARTECGAEGGLCTARPTECEDEGPPVCGCDGITYWNDCLRSAAGVTAMTVGPCTPANARTCGGGHKPPGPGPESDRCPAGTFCARLLPPVPPEVPFACPPDVPGTCWGAVPPACPSNSGPDRWTECGGSTPDLACRSTCDAIRSGKPHRHAFACP
jgi:Kazal-type serine protease inhibitor domain